MLPQSASVRDPKEGFRGSTDLLRCGPKVGPTNEQIYEHVEFQPDSNVWLALLWSRHVHSEKTEDLVQGARRRADSFSAALCRYRFCDS